MPIHTDSKMYSGGAVTWNTQPQVNMYAQLLARQQAKRDALDQYYQKALTEVTPTGMRSKDVTEGWNQKLQEWQNFAMKNREYLLNPRKDNYKTLTEFNNRHADLMADIQKSKEAAAGEKQWYELNKGGKYNASDEDMILHDRYSKSIYDPKRKDDFGNDPDLAELSYNAPDLTGNELLSFSKLAEGNLKRGKQPTGRPSTRNPITGKVEQEFQDVYTPEQATEIADNFSTLVHSNKRLYKHYNNMLHSNDLGHLTELEKWYNKVYTGDMDTPEKVAKAEKLMLLSTPSNIRVEAVPDTELAQRRKQANIYLNASLQGKGGGNYNVADLQLPDGNTDLSKPLQGINVNNLVTGKAFKSDKITYNPTDKTITYHDIVEDKDITVPTSKFRQIVSTINTAQDLKIFDNLMDGLDKAFKKPTPQKPSINKWDKYKVNK